MMERMSVFQSPRSSKVWIYFAFNLLRPSISRTETASRLSPLLSPSLFFKIFLFCDGKKLWSIYQRRGSPNGKSSPFRTRTVLDWSNTVIRAASFAPLCRCLPFCFILTKKRNLKILIFHPRFHEDVKSRSEETVESTEEKTKKHDEKTTKTEPVLHKRSNERFNPKAHLQKLTNELADRESEVEKQRLWFRNDHKPRLRQVLEQNPFLNLTVVSRLTNSNCLKNVFHSFLFHLN